MLPQALLAFCLLQPAPPSYPLDLNTATPSQLAALPGMGPEYARRVLAGRPYTAKNQLSTRGILPKEEYDRIKNLVVARHINSKP